MRLQFLSFAAISFLLPPPSAAQITLHARLISAEQGHPQRWAGEFATAAANSGDERDALGEPDAVLPLLSFKDLRDNPNLKLSDPDADGLRIHRWIKIDYPASESRNSATLVSDLEQTDLFDIVVEVDGEVEYAQWAGGNNEPLNSANLADPHRHQWYLDQTRLRHAHYYTEGRQLVTIIDGGVESTHFELSGRFVRQHSAMEGAYIDEFLPQFYRNSVGDFVTDPIAPGSVTPAHGTAVAAVIAAARNSSGMLGGCPKCDYAMLGSYAQNRADSVPQQFAASMNHGASVINISQVLGFVEYQDGRLLADVVAALDANDTVIIAAYGNNAQSLTLSPGGGAAVANNLNILARMPTVLGVGATDFSATLWNEQRIRANPNRQLRQLGVGALALQERCNPSPSAGTSQSHFLECGSNYGASTYVHAAGLTPPLGCNVTFPGQTCQFDVDLVAPGAQILTATRSIYTGFGLCEDAESIHIPATLCEGTTNHYGGPVNPRNFPPFRNKVGVNAVGNYEPLADNPTNNLFGSASGTSFAAPLVSAAAALVRSVNPLLGGAATRSLLKDTASRAVLGTQQNGQPYTANEVGSGMLNAELAVERTLGRVAGVQNRNRLLPMLHTRGRKYSASLEYHDWLHTTNPQVMMAAFESTLYEFPMLNEGVGLVNNPYTYASPHTMGIGARLPAALYEYSRAHLGVAADSSFAVFATPFNPITGQNNSLIPLYRMSLKCAPYRSHFYTTSSTERSQRMSSSGPAGPGCFANRTASGYLHEAIEGYVFPVTEAQPPGTQKLCRTFSAAHSAWALVLEDEWQRAAFSNYSADMIGAVCEAIGYVYPLVGYTTVHAPGVYPDGDQDGLADAMEAEMGLFADASDTDCDGMVDLAEYPLKTVQPAGSDPKLGAAGCADLGLSGQIEVLKPGTLPSVGNGYRAKFDVLNLRGPQTASDVVLTIRVVGDNAGQASSEQGCPFVDVSSTERVFNCTVPQLAVEQAYSVRVFLFIGDSATATVVRSVGQPDPLSGNNSSVTLGTP